MPTREESPKPYDVEDAKTRAKHLLDFDEERVVATAQAAAEADSLRARLDKLQAFKDYVHQRLDAAGVPADPEADKNAEHGCRIEGRLNFVEATAAALRAQLEEARLDFSNCADVGRRLEAALTAAQGEVAVLRAALMGSGGSCGTCVKSSLSSRTCERGTNGCDVRHWQTDEAKATLASTRATAAAHDERVRREVLDEAVAAVFKERELLTEGGELDGMTIAANVVRALAHPTKEPSTDTKEKP